MTDSQKQEHALPSDEAVATSRLWLLGLTLLYFIIEITVNIMVFKQLSIKSDFFTIEAMEFWGKIITGLGAALVLVRYCYFGSKYVKTRPKNKPHDSLFVFMSVCLLTIPVSFAAQNLLINHLANSATDDERNKAVLITAVHGVLKPHFTPENTDNEKPSVFQKIVHPIINRKDGFKDNYKRNEALHMNASIACSAIGEEALGVTTNTDKAFFAYNALKEPINEALYKSLISDYYTCLYDNEQYSENSIVGEAFPKDHWEIIEVYNKYRKASKTYEDEIFVRKSWSKTQGTADVFEQEKKDLDIEWRKGMDDFLGFESTLPPKLTEREFIHHPEVKRYFVKEADNLDYIYPYDTKFADKKDEMIRFKLPHAVIPTYIDDSGEAMGLNIPVYRNSKGEEQWIGDDLEVTDALVLERGKQAYKAIIMPQIALGLSMLFLIINLLSLLNISSKLLTNRDSKNLIFIIGLLIAVLLPSLIISTFNSDKEISNRGFIVKALYFHERNLASVIVGNNTKLKEVEVKDITH